MILLLLEHHYELLLPINIATKYPCTPLSLATVQHMFGLRLTQTHHLGTIPSTLIPFTAPFPLPPEMANLSCTPNSSAFRCPEGGCSPNCRNSIRHFKAIPLLPRPSHEDTTSQTIFLAPAFIPPNTPIQILYGDLFTPASHPPSAEHPQYHYSLPFGTTLSTASRSSVPRLLRRSPNPNCTISLLPVRLSSTVIWPTMLA